MSDTTALRARLQLEVDRLPDRYVDAKQAMREAIAALAPPAEYVVEHNHNHSDCRRVTADRTAAAPAPDCPHCGCPAHRGMSCADADAVIHPSAAAVVMGDASDRKAEGATSRARHHPPPADRAAAAPAPEGLAARLTAQADRWERRDTYLAGLLDEAAAALRARPALSDETLREMADLIRTWREDDNAGYDQAIELLYEVEAALRARAVLARQQEACKAPLDHPGA